MGQSEESQAPQPDIWSEIRRFCEPNIFPPIDRKAARRQQLKFLSYVTACAEFGSSGSARSRVLLDDILEVKISKFQIFGISRVWNSEDPDETEMCV